MKQFNRVLSILLLLCLTACGTVIAIRFPDSPDATPLPSTATALPTATASPTASPTQAIGLLARTTANVNLRIAPNTNNVPIRVLLAGTEIRLIERIADNTWARTAEGWVYTQNLSITGNINTLPIYGAIDPTPTREGAPKSRVSYNINAQAIPDRPYLEAHLLRLCPSSVLVMEDFSYAVQLYNLLRPCGTLVIHRAYSSLEGSEWFYRSPQSFIDQWKREGHPEIIRHDTNEPSFGGSQNTTQYVARVVELMRLARENGFTCACGNFSVGIIRPEDINAGLFDPYIRALIQYRHYLGLHEYAVVALPFGVGQWQTSFLLDRNRVQPASWPSALALPTRLWSGELPPYWYLLRGVWWLLRADLIGVARPLILVTEFGWDNLPNIKADIEPLRQQFGLTQYFRDMSGVNTYPNIWHYYWPQWSFAQAACEQIIWAMGVYPIEFIGFNLFTWSINPNWRQTDFSGRENPALFELHTCLERAVA